MNDRDERTCSGNAGWRPRAHRRRRPRHPRPRGVQAHAVGVRGRGRRRRARRLGVVPGRAPGAGDPGRDDARPVRHRRPAQDPRQRARCRAGPAAQRQVPRQRRRHWLRRGGRRLRDQAVQPARAPSPGQRDARPSPVTTRQLLLGIELLVLLACLVLALSVIWSKVTRLRRERRTAQSLAPVRGALIELAAGEPGGLRILRSARGKTADAIDEAAVALLAKVRGEPANQLVTVLEDHGALERAKAEVSHRSPVRRARAVQLLGLARVEDSTALISEALEDEASEVRASASYPADPWLAAPLLRSVGTGEGIPAGLAADALLEMGVEIAPVLRAAMRNPAPRTRMVAAHVAGVGTFVQALPELRELVG